jgi:hypothetical protein
VSVVGSDTGLDQYEGACTGLLADRRRLAFEPIEYGNFAGRAQYGAPHRPGGLAILPIEPSRPGDGDGERQGRIEEDSAQPGHSLRLGAMFG